MFLDQGVDKLAEALQYILRVGSFMLLLYELADHHNNIYLLPLVELLFAFRLQTLGQEFTDRLAAEVNK